MQIDQKTRKEQLIIAEQKAVELFDETINRGYVEPGISEKDLSVKIHDLAFEMYETKQHWHKRIVRAGKNLSLIHI